MTAIASARRIFEVMDETGTEEDAQNSVEIENSEGRVDFEAVNFSYELSHPLIRDFSLSVEPGQHSSYSWPDRSRQNYYSQLAHAVL